MTTPIIKLILDLLRTMSKCPHCESCKCAAQDVLAMIETMKEEEGA